MTDRLRLASFVIASLSVLHLLAVLGLGYLVVTTDWRALECFDGTEPGCNQPAPEAGLSAVRVSTWLIAGVAAASAIGALMLAFRVDRRAQVPAVLLLCAVSAAGAQALWWRL